MWCPRVEVSIRQLFSGESEVLRVRAGYPWHVSRRQRPGTVYSSHSGRTCPGCGWPVVDCRCSHGLDEPVPDRIVARLRIERAGRRGKTVTVVEGLPRNAAFLKGLAGELKRACGSGGTVVEDRVEMLRGLLARRGWTVKG
jgi:translation initiation factor 1